MIVHLHHLLERISVNYSTHFDLILRFVVSVRDSLRLFLADPESVAGTQVKMGSHIHATPHETSSASISAHIHRWTPPTLTDVRPQWESAGNSLRLSAPVTWELACTLGVAMESTFACCSGHPHTKLYFPSATPLRQN
jgi:hypothetical protein